MPHATLSKVAMQRLASRLKRKLPWSKSKAEAPQAARPVQSEGQPIPAPSAPQRRENTREDLEAQEAACQAAREAAALRQKQAAAKGLQEKVRELAQQKKASEKRLLEEHARLAAQQARLVAGGGRAEELQQACLALRGELALVAPHAEARSELKRRLHAMQAEKEAAMEGWRQEAAEQQKRHDGDVADLGLQCEGILAVRVTQLDKNAKELQELRELQEASAKLFSLGDQVTCDLAEERARGVELESKEEDALREAEEVRARITELEEEEELRRRQAAEESEVAELREKLRLVESEVVAARADVVEAARCLGLDLEEAPSETEHHEQEAPEEESVAAVGCEHGQHAMVEDEATCQDTTDVSVESEEVQKMVPLHEADTQGDCDSLAEKALLRLSDLFFVMEGFDCLDDEVRATRRSPSGQQATSALHGALTALDTCGTQILLEILEEQPPDATASAPEVPEWQQAAGPKRAVPPAPPAPPAPRLAEAFPLPEQPDTGSFLAAFLQHQEASDHHWTALPSAPYLSREPITRLPTPTHCPIAAAVAEAAAAAQSRELNELVRKNSSLREEISALRTRVQQRAMPSEYSSHCWPAPPQHGVGHNLPGPWQTPQPLDGSRLPRSAVPVPVQVETLKGLPAERCLLQKERDEQELLRREIAAHAARVGVGRRVHTPRAARIVPPMAAPQEPVTKRNQQPTAACKPNVGHDSFASSLLCTATPARCTVQRTVLAQTVNVGHGSLLPDHPPEFVL